MRSRGRSAPAWRLARAGGSASTDRAANARPPPRNCSPTGRTPAPRRSRSATPNFVKEKSWGLEGTLRGSGNGYSVSASAIPQLDRRSHIYEGADRRGDRRAAGLSICPGRCALLGFEVEGSARLAQIGSTAINVDALADYVRADDHRRWPRTTHPAAEAAGRGRGAGRAASRCAARWSMRSSRTASPISRRRPTPIRWSMPAWRSSPSARATAPAWCCPPTTSSMSRRGGMRPSSRISPRLPGAISG